MKNSSRGLYAWGGPGTIRLLQTKYHSPTIDTDSFMHLYDEAIMRKAQDVFSHSDIWVSYSWGFSDKTEEGDKAFIQEKIKSLQKRDVRIHLYVQGLNLVSSDFPIDTLACRDVFGRMIPYSKGRTLICPNNPHAQQILRKRVTEASSEDADGVYVDNILFGFPPAFIRTDYAPFFGCACEYCQTQFQKTFSYRLQFPIVGKQKLSDYLTFRGQTTKQLIAELSAIAHKADKYFGINLYDPVQMNPQVYFGYDIDKIEPYLDYLMIENHSLPTNGRSNEHLRSLIKTSDKPVFVLSYDQGIGFESEYMQTDFDSIASEGRSLGYHPCLKVSEFTTNGIWHALDFSKLHKVNVNLEIPTKTTYALTSLKPRQWYDHIVANIIGYSGIPLVQLYFENAYMQKIGEIFYRRGIHAWKNFSL